LLFGNWDHSVVRQSGSLLNIDGSFDRAVELKVSSTLMRVKSKYISEIKDLLKLAATLWASKRVTIRYRLIIILCKKYMLKNIHNFPYFSLSLCIIIYLYHKKAMGINIW